MSDHHRGVTPSSSWSGSAPPPAAAATRHVVHADPARQSYHHNGADIGVAYHASSHPSLFPHTNADGANRHSSSNSSNSRACPPSLPQPQNVLDELVVTSQPRQQDASRLATTAPSGGVPCSASDTTALVAASPLLFACRSVVGSLEAERFSSASGTQRRGGAAFCDPELLKRLSGVLECQRTLVWEATSAAASPTQPHHPQMSASSNRRSSPPSSCGAAHFERHDDPLVAAIAAAAAGSPVLSSTFASSVDAAVSAMVSCGQPQRTSPRGGSRTSPRSGGGRTSPTSHFSASASSTSSVFDAVVTPSSTFPASALPPPPHDPFTDGEPLRWVVPPGVGDVAVADLSVHWSLTAGAQFSSVISNAAVLRGKWMYEVTLSSSGLLQIGWSGPMMLFPWTPRLGVGDFPFTIAFDGHRQQLWNVQATACGHRWAAGDVITCCLDLDEGVATFYQNGERIGVKEMLTAANADARASELRRSMIELGYPAEINASVHASHFLPPQQRGAHPNLTSSPLNHGGDVHQLQHQAFPPGVSSVSSPLRYDTTLCYSPALSLGQYESAVVNLGRAPFRYPVAGYTAVDRQGALETSLWRARASLLIDTDGPLRPYRSTVLLALVQQLRLATTQHQQQQQQQQVLHHNINGTSPPVSPTLGAGNSNGGSGGDSNVAAGLTAGHSGAWHAFSLMCFDAFLHHHSTNSTFQQPCPACSPASVARNSSQRGQQNSSSLSLDALCTTCGLLTLLEMCLQPDEVAAVATTIASYCAFRAGSRRLDSSAFHTWTSSPELRILQFCTAKSAMFRRAWSQSPSFCGDLLNVFRIKAPSNFDLMSVLFPVNTERTATVIRRQRNVPSPGQYALGGATTPPGNSHRTSPTSQLGGNGAAAGHPHPHPHHHHVHHHHHHHHHHHFHHRGPTAVPPEDEEPIPTPDEAQSDHEHRSSVLHECVIGLDDNRREGILSALLDCPHSEGPTVLVVSMAVDELRKLLAANQQQMRGANGGVLPQHMRPRTSDVCVDSAVAARLFFALIHYIGRSADEVRRSTLAAMHHYPQDAASPSGAGGNRTTTTQTGDPQQQSAKAAAVRNALRDVFLPPSILREPLIEGIEFTRLGGPHSTVLRNLAAAHPQWNSEQQHRSKPHPMRTAKSTLFIKCIILYSAAVKELVISACGDMLLRHRQREAWHLHLQALQADANDDAVKQQQQQQQQQQSLSQPTSQTNRMPPTQHHRAAPASPPHQNSSSTQPPSRRLSEVAANRLLLDMLVSGRSCAWSTSTLFLTHRGFEDIGEFCSIVADVMSSFDELPDYPLLPIVLVECFVDVWHYARKTAPNYVKLVHMFPQNIMFFVDRVLDPRIAHVETNEYLLLSLAGILDSMEAHREAVAFVLSQHQRAWHAALHRLTRQFEHPLGWPLSVGVWTKLGIGNYFCLSELEDDSAEWRDAFPLRLRTAAATASSVVAPKQVGAPTSSVATAAPVAISKPVTPTAFRFYRDFFATVFFADATFARQFFRQVVTRCHYCVSELGVSLSAVWQHLSTSPNSSGAGGNSGGSTLSPQEFSTLRRRCGAVFELTRKVLHILEFTLDAGRHILLPGPLSSMPTAAGVAMSSSSSTSSSLATQSSTSSSSSSSARNIHPSEINSPSGSASNRNSANNGPAVATVTSDAQHNLQLLLELWTQSISRFCTPKASIALVEQFVANSTAQRQHPRGGAAAAPPPSHPVHALERLRQWKLMAPLLGILHGMVDAGRSLDVTTNAFLARLGSKDYTWPMEAVTHMLRGGDANASSPNRWVEMNRGVPWDKCRGFLITPTSVASPPIETTLRSIAETVMRKQQQQLQQKGTSSNSNLNQSGGGSAAQQTDDGQVEDGTCLICMIRDADTSFSPCGHVSCMDCINRHISSGSGRCFWCNKAVTGLRPVSVVLAVAAAAAAGAPSSSSSASSSKK